MEFGLTEEQVRVYTEALTKVPLVRWSAFRLSSWPGLQ